MAGKRPYVPMKDEIEAETARIRAGWDDEEHRRRAGLKPKVRLYVTVVGVPELNAIIAEARHG